MSSDDTEPRDRGCTDGGVESVDALGDTDEAPRDRVVRVFEREFETAPTTLARAPGRVNLIGGHVDYNGGIVLPAAIDRQTVVAARPRTDDTVRVHSVREDETITASVGSDCDGWSAYVVGTATTLSEDVGEPLGADLAVDGDVIVGAGVSSSAALEVAVAGALDAVHHCDRTREQLADACWRAENEEVGMACGIMDQFASALGQPGHALRIDCRSRDVQPVGFDDAAADILVIDTTVSHELVDSGFNERVRECHEATARLDELLGKRVRTLRDVTPAEVTTHADDLPEPLAARARHVTTEIERVREAADALADGRVDRVGELIRESHRSLRDDYEVSCEELDTVVETLDDCSGSAGARMVGGGWGGSVVALVDPAARETVADTVREEYRAATGIDCEVYTVDFGGGLSVESV
ncbi:galactokinase [Halobaculum sp. MBLA0147]|uniref:galactokinase n=1 Tax=Halobaculum sp. MBLA0147 TaxID=3079934 RepID=UPI0035243B57